MAVTTGSNDSMAAALWKLEMAMSTTGIKPVPICDIFVSFSACKLSKEIITKFNEWMTSNGKSKTLITYDYRDIRVNPLGEWPPRQQFNALNTCVLMVLVTKEFLKSRQCARELGIALAARYDQDITEETTYRTPVIMPIFVARTDAGIGEIFDCLKKAKGAKFFNPDEIKRYQLLQMNGRCVVLKDSKSENEPNAQLDEIFQLVTETAEKIKLERKGLANMLSVPETSDLPGTPVPTHIDPPILAPAVALGQWPLI